MYRCLDISFWITDVLIGCAHCAGSYWEWRSGGSELNYSLARQSELSMQSGLLSNVYCMSSRTMLWLRPSHQTTGKIDKITTIQPRARSYGQRLFRVKLKAIEVPDQLLLAPEDTCVLMTTIAICWRRKENRGRSFVRYIDHVSEEATYHCSSPKIDPSTISRRHVIDLVRSRIEIRIRQTSIEWFQSQSIQDASKMNK